MPRKIPHSEKELANLKPIQKGEVRNPTGRPKGALSLVTLLKKALEEDYIVYETEPTGKLILDENGKRIVKKIIQKKDAVITSLIVKAIEERDMQAINTLLDRVDGKVIQPIDQTIREVPKIQVDLND